MSAVELGLGAVEQIIIPTTSEAKVWAYEKALRNYDVGVQQATALFHEDAIKREAPHDPLQRVIFISRCKALEDMGARAMLALNTIGSAETHEEGVVVDVGPDGSVLWVYADSIQCYVGEADGTVHFQEKPEGDDGLAWLHDPESGPGAQSGRKIYMVGGVHGVTMHPNGDTKLKSGVVVTEVTMKTLDIKSMESWLLASWPDQKKYAGGVSIIGAGRQFYDEDQPVCAFYIDQEHVTGDMLVDLHNHGQLVAMHNRLADARTDDLLRYIYGALDVVLSAISADPNNPIDGENLSQAALNFMSSAATSVDRV